jgi:hypothetical protein
MWDYLTPRDMQTFGWTRFVAFVSRRWVTATSERIAHDEFSLSQARRDQEIRDAFRRASGEPF